MLVADFAKKRVGPSQLQTNARDATDQGASRRAPSRAEANRRIPSRDHRKGDESTLRGKAGSQSGHRCEHRPDGVVGAVRNDIAGNLSAQAGTQDWSQPVVSLKFDTQSRVRPEA